MIRLNLFIICFLYFLSLLSVICRYYRQNSSSRIIVVLVYTVSTSFFIFIRKGVRRKRAQRKIPVDLHFIVRLRHKASGAALGLSCAVCFEQPAGVFAGCGAVC